MPFRNIDDPALLKRLLDAGLAMEQDLDLEATLRRIIAEAVALVDAIRRVAAGESLLDPAVTRRVLERLRSEPEEDEGLARLSEQERKVLDLIAEGYTNRQIGEHLFLAEKTVKNYVSNLLMKLGMKRRTEAAVFAVRQLDDERRG